MTTKTQQLGTLTAALIGAVLTIALFATLILCRAQIERTFSAVSISIPSSGNLQEDEARFKAREAEIQAATRRDVAQTVKKEMIALTSLVLILLYALKRLATPNRTNYVLLASGVVAVAACVVLWPRGF